MFEHVPCNNYTHSKSNSLFSFAPDFLCSLSLSSRERCFNQITALTKTSFYGLLLVFNTNIIWPRILLEKVWEAVQCSRFKYLLLSWFESNHYRTMNICILFAIFWQNMYTGNVPGFNVKLRDLETWNGGYDRVLLPILKFIHLWDTYLLHLFQWVMFNNVGAQDLHFVVHGKTTCRLV